MTFDAAEYRKRVLTPYKGAKLGTLQAALRELKDAAAPKQPSGLDLAELYDISAGMPDAEIAARVSDIGNCFTMCVTNAAFKSIGPSLVELHKTLAQRNPDLATGAFWARIGQAQAQRTMQDLDDFAVAAAGALSSLGVVTTERLRALARASRVPDSVSDADLQRAVQPRGIEIVQDFPRPSATVPAAIPTELQQSSCRSILSAIFLSAEPATFRIVDGYRGDDPGQRLTLEAVKAARSAVEKLAPSPDNDAMKKIHGILITAAPTDAALADLVLAYFVDLGRQLSAANPIPALALKKFVESTGIDRVDAARILLAFEGETVKVGGFAEVQAKVAEGSLKEARRIYDASFASVNGSETAEQRNAEAALVLAETRLATLRAEAKAAVESGDTEAAARALNEALTICTDDESLAEMARALPPAAPLRLVVSADDTGRRVRVSWEPGFGSTDEVVYQVIRKSGSAPVGNLDGEVLAPKLTATTFEDSAPPVAAELYYGVSATRGGGLSPAATAKIVVLPPVRGVKVSSDPTSVTLGWESPPGARTIRVQQSAPDGTSSDIPINGQSGATSHGLVTGATYTYLVTAVYTSSAGATLASAPVRVTAVPRGEAKPLAMFTLTERSTDQGASEVDVSWGAIDGFPVEIWHYPERPPWRFGERIPMAQVRSLGTRLTGRETGNGERRQGVRGAPGAGLRYYTAITSDGDDGIVGQVQELGVCPPMRNVTAERFGDEVLLAWDWPGPEFDVKVAWTGGLGPGERIVSLNRYREGGGCRIPIGGARTTFRISSTAAQAEGEWSSPETTLVVEAANSPVRYSVAFGRKLFGPATSATLAFESATPPPYVDVIVVGSRSQVMPRDATQGVVLAEYRIDPSDPDASTFDVELPRGRGPVWVRAFATSPGSRLVDPPASQMKGE